MSKNMLASQNVCTGCGSCAESCPVQCIQMKADAGTGCTYPSIDTDACLLCGRCSAACPVIHVQQKQEKGAVYVAWNMNQEQRRCAASGGIISATYQYALEKGIRIFGTQYSVEEGANYIEISSWQDVEKCRNSKYVFSNIRPILKKVKQYLKNGEQVILPALPCQAAAALAFLGSRPDNLLLIDIVCHGVCPDAYLKQHIKAIEQKTKKKADNILFRDPNYGTKNYMFSFYQNNTPFYHAPVYDRDVYQLGYHCALSYRENCYQCAYATPERLGDLTVSDFSGLGREAPFERDSESYSCVIVSTPKGQAMLDALYAQERINYQLRPSNEAFMYERQLQSPSRPHLKRDVFLREYLKSRDFDVAARTALRKDIAKNQLIKFLRLKQLRQVIAGILPTTVKQSIRKVIKHGK